MQGFFQLVVAGILTGVSYGVLAAGLALIFGVMNIINFAHAAFAVLAWGMVSIPGKCWANHWRHCPRTQTPPRSNRLSAKLSPATSPSGKP